MQLEVFQTREDVRRRIFNRENQFLQNVFTVDVALIWIDLEELANGQRLQFRHPLQQPAIELAEKRDMVGFQSSEGAGRAVDEITK